MPKLNKSKTSLSIPVVLEVIDRHSILNYMMMGFVRVIKKGYSIYNFVVLHSQFCSHHCKSIALTVSQDAYAKWFRKVLS